MTNPQAFIDACLAPTPAIDPKGEDIRFRRQVRSDMKEAWWHRRQDWEFAHHFAQAMHARWTLVCHRDEEFKAEKAQAWADKEAAERMLEAAIDALAVCPAPTKEDLQHKKRVCRRKDMQEAWQAAITADEERLSKGRAKA